MDKKVGINAILSIIFVISNSLLGFIKIPIVINTFGHFENGFYTKLLTLAVTFKIVDVGITGVLNSTVSRYFFKQDWEKFNKYFSMGRKLYDILTMAAICLLLALSLGLPLVEKSFVYHNSYWWSVAYIFIIFLPNAMYFFKSHYLILIYCYKDVSKIELSNFVTNIAVFLAIVISRYSVKMMFFAIILTTILTLCNDAYWKWKYWKKGKEAGLVSNLDIPVEKELISHSKYASILVAFSNVSRALNYSIIAHFYSNEIVSHYASIAVYNSAISLIFINTLLNVSYNTYLEYNSSKTKEQLYKLIQDFTLVQQGVIVIVLSATLVFFPSFLRIVGFMPADVDLRPYIYIPGLEMYLWWSMMRFNHLAYIQRKFKELLLPFTTTTIINIGLTIFFTQHFGPFGVSMGSIVQWFLMYLFLNKLVYKYFFRDLFQVIKGILVILLIDFIYTHFINLQDLLHVHNLFSYFISSLWRGILFGVFASIVFVVTDIKVLKYIKDFLLKKLNKN